MRPFDLAKEKCEKYQQQQLLAYYTELSDSEKDALVSQILETDFEVLSEFSNSGSAAKKGKIEPIDVLKISEIAKEKNRYRVSGIEAIQKGQVAAVLLAGGMGTRLGFDGPKGSYNIGITRPMYIFERIISNLLDVVKETNTWIHLFIMTSDKNNDATISFFKDHNFFGYREDCISFFKQAMAPAIDNEGKIYMESKSVLASSPNGNGGWFESMVRSGLMKIIADKNIQYLNVFAVDNVLQRIADPVFVGATVSGHYECGAKVIKKCNPDEKVGAMCLEDGKPSIIEYIDFTDEYKSIKDENGECAINYGVILNYLFEVRALQRIAEKKIPVHVVNKKIPYMNSKGDFIKPEEINGHKFETLVVDMIHLLDNCLPFEVEREKEFAPIKNSTGVDSVESARALLELNGICL